MPPGHDAAGAPAGDILSGAHGQVETEPGADGVGDRFGDNFIHGERIKEYIKDGSDITRIYRRQLAACTYEVLPGPGRLLRWSLPSSRGHDDLLISTALTARLDAIDWRDRMARGHAGP